MLKILKKSMGFALLLGTGCLLSLLLGEAFLRVMGYRGEPVAWIDNAYLVSDPVLNLRFKPGSVYKRGNVVFQFNKDGIRDIDFNYKKEVNTVRILMLGDSVTEGYGVHLKDTVGKKIESLLKQKTDRKIEVMNIAMGGLNTWQESHLLEILGVKFDPDMLILNYVLNDADNGIHFRRKVENKYVEINLLNIKVPAYLKRSLKKSALVYFIKNKMDLLLWRLDINDSDDPQRSISEDYYHAIHKDPDGLNNVIAGIKKISEIVEKKGIDSLLVIYPIMYDFKKYRWFDIHEKIASIGRQNGFPVIDLFKSFAKHSIKSVRLERGDFVHPNSFGHEVAAKEIVSVILKKIFNQR